MKFEIWPTSAAALSAVAFIAFVYLVHTARTYTLRLLKTAVATLTTSLLGLVPIQWVMVYSYPKGDAAGAYNFFNAVLVGAGVGAMIAFLWWYIWDRARHLLKQWKYISTSR